MNLKDSAYTGVTSAKISRERMSERKSMDRKRLEERERVKGKDNTALQPLVAGLPECVKAVAAAVALA